MWHRTIRESGELCVQMKAGIELNFAGHRWNIVYLNEKELNPEQYSVKRAYFSDGTSLKIEEGKAVLNLDTIKSLDSLEVHNIIVEIG